jgi:endonuclease/exonuclease/phosphatase family metal-dependent hydrolase
MKKRALMLMTALTVLVAAQLLRVYTPLIGWYLRDTVSLDVVTLGLIALAPFLLGFLAPAIARIVNLRGLWWIAGAGLFGARLAAQLSPGPGFSLWAAQIGLLCFLWFLPVLLGRGREPFVNGLMLGLALDTALKGVAGTLDLHWSNALSAELTIVLCCLLAGAILWWTGRDPWTASFPAASVPLFAIGPLLLFNWFVLQNVGWVSTLTGLSAPLALLLILAGDALALHWMSRPPVALVRRPWMTVGPGLLLLLASLTADQAGLVFAVAEVAGLISTGLLLVLIVTPADPAARFGPRALALSVGNLFLVLLLLLYYMALDLPLPFDQPEVMAAMGLLLLIGALTALRRPPVPLTGAGTARRGAWLLLIIPAFLLGRDLLFAPAAPAPGNGYPVRVMSYNIHSGFGAEGWHNPEAVARLIEESGADIVGFQEISRGAIMDGNTDMVTWLSRRLNMPHVTFMGTTDPVWGNAILSRYPLSEIERERLPKFDTRIGRGVLAAQIDLGTNQDVLFMSTHLHHAHEELARIHVAQLETVLALWAERPRTVLVGDMNAGSDSIELAVPFEAGFVDSWAEVGSGEGFTSNARNPHHRIDYILHTPDLRAADIVVPVSLASDHFPVVTTIDLAP